MKIYTPEISWHNREPVFGVDIQRHVECDKDGNKTYRLATCGSDNIVAIWRAYLNKQQQNQQQANSRSTNSLNQRTIRDQIDQDVNDIMNNLLDQSASAFNDLLPSALSSAPTLATSNVVIEENADEQERKAKQQKDKRLIDLECVCTLNFHIKAVNVAKFAPNSNLLATGSDDQFVYIYEYKGENDPNNPTDKDRCNPFNDFDDSIIAKENWKRLQTLRRHINDVVDLAWSPDERFLITGSVDNISLVWDVKKGEALFELPKHTGYVQGVSWDPLNNFIVTLCTDRNLRIFNAPTSERSKKSSLIQKINKLKLNSTDEKSKSSPLFYDDTLATISRRMSFSPNGELLACPSGIIDLDENEEDGTNKFIDCLHMFYRGDNFKKLHCYFPTGVYTNSIRFCEKLFKLNPDLPNPFPFQYRLVFAIAAKDRILIYDTQQEHPIAKISDIHYTRLSDLSWTTDGQLLLVSSTDGYCTFVYFTENELGERYEGKPFKFETVEAKKKETSTNNSISNKKIKVSTDDCNVPNENLSTEKTPQLKILNFFKPTNPLVPTKLENSFHKVSDKTKVISLENDSNDCEMIKQVLKKDENQANNENQEQKDINQVKKGPIDSFILKSSKTQVNSVQHLIKKKPIPQQPMSNTNSQLVKEPNNQLPPLKRASEQNSTDPDPKKKRISFVTLSN